MNVRYIFIALSSLCLLAGCIGSRQKGEGEEEGTAETQVTDTTAVAGFTWRDTLFVEMPIPPEIEARMRGVSYPAGATVSLQSLRYLRLSYVDFEGNDQNGELVCNKQIAKDLLDIFRALYLARYPIRSIRLIDDFGGSDDASMEADNTSCFNYRPVSGGSSLSKHALGLAVDVNPLENPYVKGNTVLPGNAAPYVDRAQSFPHKIDQNDLCYELFTAHGFKWGGSWRSLKDFQHFEK